MKRPNEEFLGQKCTECRDDVYRETSHNNDWWVKCHSCGHLVFCYTPMEHQAAFHADPAKFKMYAGGYGSAKTSTCGAETVAFSLRTPGGQGLVGAQTVPQLEETAKKQILEMVPEELRAKNGYLKQQNKLILKNGYTFLFRSFDSDEKLKSLNLTNFWIEEASNVPHDIFTQLTTRLRSRATDHHKGLLSTNPSIGWIRSDFLLKSSRIVGASEEYPMKEDEINPNYATHIAATEKNTHLPPTYVEDLKNGKADFWIQRYLYGSFNFSEGSIYPMIMDCIEDDYTEEQIEDYVRRGLWRVVAGSDFGLRDFTTLLLCAINPDTGIVYAYKEYYKNNQPIAFHARNMKDIMTHIPMARFFGHYGDPSGARKGIADNKSIFDHYAEYGVYFTKADNRIDAGIQKVYGYLSSGRLRILRSCHNLIREMSNYRYKDPDKYGRIEEKPAAGEDHLNDTIRYIMHSLPDNPDNLITETYGQAITLANSKSRQHYLPHALQDEDTSYDMPDSWTAYY